MAKSPAWTRSEGKNPEGGLNEKGRASLRAAGHDIKRPQPEGGSRKDSFCARMKGMKAKLTSSETANDPDSRINKSLRKWKCADGGPLLSETEIARQRLIEEILRKNKLSKTPSSGQSATTPYETSPATPKISKEQYNKGNLGRGNYALSTGGSAGRKRYALGGDTLDQNNSYLDEVNSLYQSIFGRAADTAGGSYWADKLATTPMTLEDLQNQFTSSDEAKNRFGDIVQQAYQESLGRKADAGGLNYWTDMLKSGQATLGDVQTQLSSSDEARINQIYQNELGRDADIDGRNYWLNQLNSGQTSLSDLEDMISGSEEARLHHKNMMSDATKSKREFADPAEALAEVMWSEGDLFRGKPNAERELSGIGWTVKNRADAGFTGNMPKWYRASHDPNNIIDQITAPSAYSHFNSSREKMARQAFEKNPELKQYYIDLANRILTRQIDDPTQGSISYYNPKVVKTPGFAAKKGLKEGFYKTTTLDADPSGQYHVYYGHNKYTPIALAKQYEATSPAPSPSTPVSPPTTSTPIVTTPGTGGVPISGFDNVGGVGGVGGVQGGGYTDVSPGGTAPSVPHTAPHVPVTHPPVTHVGGGTHPSSGDHGSFGVSYAPDVGYVVAPGVYSTDPNGRVYSPITGRYYGDDDYSYDPNRPGSKTGGAVKNAMDVARAYKKGGPVWDKPRPKSLGKPTPLSSDQKSSAKAMAKAAGRPYPNLVDNMRAAKKS